MLYHSRTCTKPTITTSNVHPTVELPAPLVPLSPTSNGLPPPPKASGLLEPVRCAWLVIVVAWPLLKAVVVKPFELLEFELLFESADELEADAEDESDVEVDVDVEGAAVTEGSKLDGLSLVDVDEDEDDVESVEDEGMEREVGSVEELVDVDDEGGGIEETTMADVELVLAIGVEVAWVDCPMLV